jgi:hypothetical protein
MDYEPTNQQARRLPVCDSYFVESMDQEEDGVFAAKRSKQEMARIHAETQLEMAEEMSRDVSEEYQEEILDHMEFMEVSFGTGGRAYFEGLED